MSLRSRITGTGSAFPETRVTNAQLAQTVDTSDSWIRERTGIQERRIAQPGIDADRNSALGARAALAALQMAGRRPEEVDAIVYATCTPDHIIPSSACLVQGRIGAHRAWAMDLNAACSGFVYALATADQFIRSGSHQVVLVIGADNLSAFTHWEDRTTSVLFGDGAGAVVLERTSEDSPSQILSTRLGADGRLWDYFQIPAGGSWMPTTAEAIADHATKMQMRGPEMYKVAVRALADLATEELARHGLSVDQLDWVIPHQANLRIIEGVLKRLNVPHSKCVVNIERFGNTSAATIPTALDEAVRTGRVRPGQLLLLNAFGAGVTSGAALVRF